MMPSKDIKMQRHHGIQKQEHHRLLARHLLRVLHLLQPQEVQPLPKNQPHRQALTQHQPQAAIPGVHMLPNQVQARHQKPLQVEVQLLQEILEV
jgi:hypothetical protein